MHAANRFKKDVVSLLAPPVAKNTSGVNAPLSSSRTLSSDRSRFSFSCRRYVDGMGRERYEGANGLNTLTSKNASSDPSIPKIHWPCCPGAHLGPPWLFSCGLKPPTYLIIKIIILLPGNRQTAIKGQVTFLSKSTGFCDYVVIGPATLLSLAIACLWLKDRHKEGGTPLLYPHGMWSSVPLSLPKGSHGFICSNELTGRWIWESEEKRKRSAHITRTTWQSHLAQRFLLLDSWSFQDWYPLGCRSALSSLAVRYTCQRDRSIQTRLGWQSSPIPVHSAHAAWVCKGRTRGNGLHRPVRERMRKPYWRR